MTNGGLDLCGCARQVEFVHIYSRESAFLFEFKKLCVLPHWQLTLCQHLRPMRTSFLVGNLVHKGQSVNRTSSNTYHLSSVIISFWTSTKFESLSHPLAIRDHPCPYMCSYVIRIIITNDRDLSCLAPNLSQIMVSSVGRLVPFPWVVALNCISSEPHTLVTGFEVSYITD